MREDGIGMQRREVYGDTVQRRLKYLHQGEIGGQYKEGGRIDH